MITIPSYSPFTTPVTELSALDLTSLSSVAEGWYVEYKREVPNSSSIAKSISAFANQYGGWLFYGIEEADDGSRTAGAFPGIPSHDVPSAEQRIRDAVRTMMHPTAHFELRAIRGPSDELKLQEGRSILVIWVPQGANAPYIHSSGRIYRRVADSSDPREINDRVVLDTLVARSRRSRNQLRRLLETSLELSEGEAKVPYCVLFFIPDPLGDIGIAPQVTFGEFAAEMKNPPGDSPGFAFDNVFSSSRGYVARQVGSNDPHTKVLTWEYFLDGTSLVTMPLRLGLPTDRKAYQQHSQLELLCAPSQITRVLDLNSLLNAVAACVATHWRLSRTFGVPLRTWAKARLENVWRTVPFIDTAAFIRFASEYGLPTVQQDEFFAPVGTSLESLVYLSVDPNDQEAMASDIGSALDLSKEMLYGLGVPVDALGEASEFLEAGARGAEVASGRRR